MEALLWRLGVPSNQGVLSRHAAYLPILAAASRCAGQQFTSRQLRCASFKGDEPRLPQLRGARVEVIAAAQLLGKIAGPAQAGKFLVIHRCSRAAALSGFAPWLPKEISSISTRADRK